MVPQADSKAEWNILKSTQRIALSMMQKTMAYSPLTIQSKPARLDTTPPPLRLPFPDDILAPLLTLKLPEKTRQDLIQSITYSVNKLQKEYQDSYRYAYSHSIILSDFDNGPSNIRDTFQAFYQRNCLPMIRSQVSYIVAEYAKYQHARPDRKRPFNNEYTPVLEKYFDLNAYPSALDRLALAGKSGMTPRQIEVWFQNHRKRAKQQGKTLKRLTSESPLHLSYDSFEQRMPFHAVQERNRLGSPDDDSSDEDTEDEFITKSPLPSVEYSLDNLNRPRHAFPSTYPPNCSEDPFPNENGVFTFPPPTWTRQPVTTKVQHAAVDMDEFVSIFASKLNLRESLDGRQNGRHINRPTVSSTPWFAATVTTPSPAPHPALIRTPVRATPSSSSSSTKSASPTDRRSRSTTPITPSPYQSNPQRRKVARLPRRAPSNATTYLATAPSSPASSPSSLPSSSSSRTSSFSSVSSFQSRSSSLSSISSREPTTPPMSPSSQPQELIVEDMSELFEFEGLSQFTPTQNVFSKAMNNPMLPFNFNLSHIPSFTSYVAAS
ncbi:hypothetical protein B0H34DRAFT_792351 [Crassisporium funariophilum]|nr:hypothetical protein B0H34DRAFT_792351 [Crassisporium funariophilum]